MGLTVTILGSGTCVPSLRRSSCSVLMESEELCLLFDCGSGTTRRLLETGKTIDDLSHIFLSHFHPDHCSELASILFSTKYPHKAGRQKPLCVVAGKGLLRLYDGLKRVYGNGVVLADGMLELKELNADDTGRFLDLGAATVHWGPVNHNPESLAYRVTAGEFSIVYSGDTDESDDLVNLSRKADLLICESAFPDDEKRQGHLSPSTAGRIASRAAVGKLVLTHLYPVCDSVDLIQQCRRTWDGPVVRAEDLMVIKK